MSRRSSLSAGTDQPPPDDDAERQLKQSRQYIEDFDRVVQSSASASQVVDAMMSNYAGFGNPYTLFVSAHSQFG